MKIDNDLFTFIRSDDGSGFKRAKIKSLEVFKFLQKYAGDNFEFEVIYPKGETFEENEVQIPGNNPIVTPSNPPTNNNNLVELTIEKITKDQDGNCQVEVKEKNISGSNTLTFCKNVYKPIPDKDEGFVAHPNTDSFYFFAHNLGKETSVPISQGSKCIFLIDGSNREGEPTPILDIINNEKAKWDSLGYTAPEDLQQETKYLVDAGFKKDGEEYKLYQDLKKMAADFSKDRVGGRPINLYPSKSGMDKFTGPWKLAFAYTNWNDESNPSKGWRVHVRLDDPSSKIRLLFVLAHELTHTIIMLKEEEHKNSEKNYSPAELNKKILDGTFLYPTQSHSRAFWQVLFDGKDWEDGKGEMISNIEYLKGKLSANEKNEFDQYIKVSNENVSNWSVRWVYFIYGVSQENLVGKIRRKKYFDESEIDAAWEGIRRRVLEFASNSMNNPSNQAEDRWKGWTKTQNSQDLAETSEGRKRWVQIEVRQRNEDDDGRRKYKIYIYHNNINGKFEWIDKNGEKKEISAETMNPIADDLFQNLEISCTTDEGWEIEGIISSPRTRNLDESFYEVCSYQAQEQQAQIQIPPK